MGAGAEEGEWVEVGVGVIGVGVFGALEEVDDEIGERRGEDLVGDLEAVAGDDEPHECGCGIVAGEGKDDDDGRVDGLADDGGAYGASPKPAAACEDFEAGHGVGVGELAGPEGDEAGEEQARKDAEDGDEGLLIVETGIGGKCNDERANTPHERGAAEAEPDGAARSGIAVDLGEDVSEDIGDGEEKQGAGERDRADADDLLGDEVGDEQDDDKGGDEDVEVSELAHRGQGY